MKKEKILSIIISIAGMGLFLFSICAPKSLSHFLKDNHIQGPVHFLSLFIIVLGILYFFVFKFNLWVSGNARFKPYFISRYNIMTSKVRYIQEIDLPKKLLFIKLVEIMPAAGF